MIDVSNRVLTNIKSHISNLCQSVASSNNDDITTFPTTYIVQIDNPERAVDLENSENAVYSSVEIQVYSNKSLAEAKQIINKCCDGMRLMGYERKFGPSPVNNASNKNIYRVIARFSRIVSSVEEISKF